ncbi:hypothetical protein [Streptosporangium saharense]|uniref:hypothetical protein n=1 Tax=Streptosporangium saharense TaxID=1706840 RepID=UPI003330E1E0
MIGNVAWPKPDVFREVRGNRTTSGHDDGVNTPTNPDPDLRHLTDLLDFLPGPDDREFWDLVDSGQDLPLDGLTDALNVLRDPAPHDGRIVHLAEYLMAFFDREGPELVELLDERLRRLDLPTVALGRHWISDLTATCWRLLVRYNADGSWAKKWPESNYVRPTRGRS